MTRTVYQPGGSRMLRLFWIPFLFLSLPALQPSGAIAGEHPIIQLRDFDQTEVKAGGFRLAAQTQIHVKALGAGYEKRTKREGSEMYAYGWIIDADTRELVWRMDLDNTSRQ